MKFIGELNMANCVPKSPHTTLSMGVRRDQRAVCCVPRAARRPVALRRRPFHYANPRARHERAFAACRRCGRLPSAAWRRALRSGCDMLTAPLRSPLHFPRSPTADRSRDKSQGGNTALQDDMAIGYFTCYILASKNCEIISRHKG